MNIEKVTKELKEKYPGKKVVRNNDSQEEVICEVDPGTEHPEYGVVVAVLDKIEPHSHQKTSEEYEVLQGELVLRIDDQTINLSSGSKITVKPGQTHWATGQETWIRVTARPAWTIADHILESK